MCRPPELFDPGDRLVVNDAATLPASLSGIHLPSGLPAEVRLAGRCTLDAADVRAFTALAFGAGDHRTRTEDRALPPRLQAGGALERHGYRPHEFGDSMWVERATAAHGTQPRSNLKTATLASRFGQRLTTLPL